MSKNESVLAPVATLEVSPEGVKVLGAIGINTVEDLAQSSLFQFANELTHAVLDPTHPLHRFGVPAGRVSKAFGGKPVEAIVAGPLTALGGVTAPQGKQIAKALGVKTVRDLALWPPFLRARQLHTEAALSGTVSGKASIYRVSGFVVRKDGSRVPSATLKFEQQGVLKVTPVIKKNTVKTNAQGAYIFEYPQPTKPIDLRVELVADTANDIPEARSRVITDVGDDERIDFVVENEAFQGASVFESIEAALTSVLKGEGLQPADIVDFDQEALARLALRVGIDPRILVLVRQSFALAKETGLSAEIFLGMGLQKLPLGLAALLAVDPANRRNALTKALEANQISLKLQKAAAVALAKLDDMTITEALKKALNPDKTSLGSLLTIAGLSTTKQQKLAEAYVNHTGTHEEFWKQTATGILAADEVAKTQLILQLGVVTQNHAPLVSALLARGVANIGDLGSMERSDWLDLIKGTAGNPPAGLPGALKAAALADEDYADIVLRLLEDAIPTKIIVHHLAKLTTSAPTKTFFQHNPDFDFRATPVGSYLAAHGNALSFAANDDERKEVAKQLKRLERTYRIAPAGARVDTMGVLLKGGVDSAQKIRTIGRAAFLRRFTPSLGNDRARKVWARANNASAVAATVLARHSALFDRTPIHVMPKRVGQLAKLTMYEETFGSLDFCSCEHCLSVFGPAAYLVDVLHWLDLRSGPAGSTLTALDVLFNDRRADIGTIALSCANSNTSLPYIDLVNEILELAVSPPATTPAYQTSGAAADLRTHPEHLHEAAYDVLAGALPSGKDAVYPFNLPFNLWIEEARTYLGQLGVSRHQLMEHFHGPAARTSEVVAAEALGMSPIEWDIIAGQEQPARSVAAHWGLPGDEFDDALFVSKLTKVSTFLDRATPSIAEHGMEFEELAELLRTDFVQQGSPIGIWFDNQTCDTTNAELMGLNKPALGRMHRFIRLRRRLNWTATDLDRAISALGAGQLDAKCLLRISHVVRVAAELRLPVSEILGWWAPLDTRRWRIRLKRGAPAALPAGSQGSGMVFDSVLTPQPATGEDASPYDRLFQAATTSVEPSLVFGVRADGLALMDESQNLFDHVASVAGPLGMTGEDLVALLPRLPDGRLTLANLSALHRHTSLARALGLSVAELVAFIGFTGIEPFDFSKTEQALSLIEERRSLAKSGFSVAEVDYLLRHRDTKPATLEPGDDEIGVVLLELGVALRKLDTALALPPTSTKVDELRKDLSSRLSMLLEGAHVTEALAIADVDVDAGGVVPPNAAQFIDDKLAGALNTIDAKRKLADHTSPEFLSDLEMRLRYAISAVASRASEVRIVSTIAEKVASAVGLDVAIAAPLIRDYMKHPDASGKPLLDVFRDEAVQKFKLSQPGSDEPVLPTAPDLPDQFAAYRRLHKVALILSRLRVRKEELSWVLRDGPARGTLDFLVLPIDSNAAAVPYDSWSRLCDAVQLRNQLVPRALFDLFDAAALAEAQGSPSDIVLAHEELLAELGHRSRWELPDIEFLVGTPVQPGALGFAYPADWKDERPLGRLADVMSLVPRIGLPAATVWPWRDLPASAPGLSEQHALDRQQTQANEIKQAVRARHSEAQWMEVAAGLRDRLREKQRDALVGWLIGNDSRFADANALFEHFLIDTEMSGCQLTSRIKQAISSTQTFVQRALMNLEVDSTGTPLVALDEGDANEWEWVKNYRVWEANRKVFLYPENWIEPELRDDKTPFFKELEEQLLQEEITAGSAERALHSYLEKLDQVARLQVVALHHQKDDSTDVLHVFARTRGSPGVHFYRQYRNGTSWTPWEKIDVDIESKHLIPYVFNRRLYLFWAMISDSALETEPPAIKGNQLEGSPSLPSRYYQIRLAWIEKKTDNWSAKNVATRFVGDDIREQGDIAVALEKLFSSETANFYFLAFEEANDLIIQPVRDYGGTTAQTLARIIAPDLSAGSGGGIFVDPGDHAIPPEDDTTPVDESQNTGRHRTQRFRFSGCDGLVTLEDAGPISNVFPPSEMSLDNQRYFRESPTPTLTWFGQDPLSGTFVPTHVLDDPIAPFEIVPPRFDRPLGAQEFVYQDLRRSFFVSPIVYVQSRRPPVWVDGGSVGLDVAEMEVGGVGMPQPAAIDVWQYDPGVAATSETAIFVSRPRRNSLPVSGRGLAAITPIGSRLVPNPQIVGGEFARPRSSTTALRVDARVVDTEGQVLASVRGANKAGGADDVGTIVLLRTFTLPPLEIGSAASAPVLKRRIGGLYRFDAFYHPYVCVMLRELNRFGLMGIYNPDSLSAEKLRRQERRDEKFFAVRYTPHAVQQPFPVDAFDFSFGGSYSAYNWEVFFHIPFSIACQLSRSKRFAEAQKWFHAIFDPTATDGDAPQRFWKVKPFFELFISDENTPAGPIHELLLLLQYDGSEPDKLRQRDELLAQIAEWRINPFNPHALARLRLAAYARATVLKYIDNLIEWGDTLFRRDTLESINEATQLYVLASQILGRRPRRVDVEPVTPRSFNDLRPNLDEFSNALVEEIEGYLPEVTDSESDVHEDDVEVIGSTLFFCIPPNDHLLTHYWSRVADRLFKIRHCMNFEGVVRQLPLFEPPIDPGLLVRATALGLDLASALSDINVALPIYRYQVLAQKANELCSDVRGMGQALLAALEKKDAEELSLLRAGHEIKLESAMLDVRRKQIRDAKETLDGLRLNKENTEIRRDFYGSRDFMNTSESLQFGLTLHAGLVDAMAQVSQLLSSGAANFPDLQTGGAGFGGSPVVVWVHGGSKASSSAAHGADALGTLARIEDRAAQLAGMMGGFQRRADDWKLQLDTAQKEIEALDKQIAAAEIRLAIANKELSNLELQLEQSREAEEFLRTKYTNDQLYQWMVGQLSSLYFQGYQLAYDMAKKAERAWQFELAKQDEDQHFIQFGYWDGLKKGLLAGDKLHHDLKRMEVNFLDENRREYEITKHLSLTQIDPRALVQLRQTGACTFALPEVLFDLDFPGHFMRRIKTVSISVPCVTGPYVGVNCTMRLLRSSVRYKTETSGGYERAGVGDNRFKDSFGPAQSIVASSGQNDSGLFETNLRDERYLPFEGMGVISDWQLELPTDFRPFDYDTIADVIVHIRYTGRDGGSVLRDAAIQELQDAVNQIIRSNGEQGFARIFSLRREFPSEWHRLNNPQPTSVLGNSFTAALPKERFPFLFSSRNIEISKISVLIKVNPDFGTTHNQSTLKASLAPGDVAPIAANHVPSDLIPMTNRMELLEGEKTLSTSPGSFTLNMWLNGGSRLDPAAISDVTLICQYMVT